MRQNGLEGHTNFCDNSEREGANMLLDIPFPMNYVIIDMLALNLVDICLNDTLQTLCKSLLFFAKIWKD